MIALPAFADQADGPADEHQGNSGDHYAGDSQMDACLDRGIVDKPPGFFGNDVIFIQLDLNDFPAQRKALQGSPLNVKPFRVSVSFRK